MSIHTGHFIVAVSESEVIMAFHTRSPSSAELTEFPVYKSFCPVSHPTNLLMSIVP